jgi:hypothetical protein
MFKTQIRHGLFAVPLRFACFVALTGCLCAPARAQGAPPNGNQTAAQAADPSDPPAEQVFKNIQALKGMPASQMKTVMSLISTSVGMKCEQCHVPDAPEKDDKRAKQTARHMIQLTLDLNKTGFEGQTQVTCYSCHRGQGQPVSTPPVGQAAMPAAPPAPRPSTAGLPTYDQIVEKYLQGVGSSAAYEKLKSRVMKGSMVDAKGSSYPVEVYQAAPSKIVMITTLPNGISAQGYNGASGWTTNPNGQTELKGPELARIKRTADLARPLKIREESLSPRVMGKVNVGDREAYQVSARADGQRVLLLFDVQTGLLLRRRVTSTTILGAFPEQLDFEDYREVDGVKLSFLIRYSTVDPSLGTTTEFKEIVHNGPVDDARFNPPGTQK